MEHAAEVISAVSVLLNIAMGYWVKRQAETRKAISGERDELAKWREWLQEELRQRMADERMRHDERIKALESDLRFYREEVWRYRDEAALITLQRDVLAERLREHGLDHSLPVIQRPTVRDAPEADAPNEAAAG